MSVCVQVWTSIGYYPGRYFSYHPFLPLTLLTVWVAVRARGPAVLLQV